MYAIYGVCELLKRIKLRFFFNVQREIVLEMKVRGKMLRCTVCPFSTFYIIRLSGKPITNRIIFYRYCFVGKYFSIMGYTDKLSYRKIY